MDVRIDNKMCEALRSVLAYEPFELTTQKIGYRNYHWLDLSDFKTKDLKRLAEECENNYHIRGVSTLKSDIDNWIEASASSQNSAGQIRARSTRQACSLMINYLRKFPRHHLYTRIQEGNEGVTLCYYIEKITFTEKRRDYPEFFTIRMIHQILGVSESTSISFGASACVGKTPHQMLTDKGYYIETDIMRSNYEDYFDRFHQIKDLIGNQFLAVGLADDEGIDGNEKKRIGWWYSSRSTNLLLDKDGEPSRVVIDIFKEDTDDDDDYSSDRKNCKYEDSWWKYQSKAEEDDTEIELTLKEMKALENGEKINRAEIPIHPYVVCFDLKRHKRLKIHVGNLTEYKYDPNIRKKLILPERNSKLLDTLLSQKETNFKDVLKGKTGGVIILCQGKPGTGKTLTAEVYAESLGRALYTVQCSQLGTNPEELESNLLKILARGRRWNAVMLLDEADVYVHERGSDLQQNAIVGVFLRVLEYQSGSLFLTTNRGDLVDDAILSRCTARIPYEIPDPDHQELIWQVLAEVNGVDAQLTPMKIKKIVERFPHLSGRDCKNLLKLAIMDGRPLNVELMAEMKDFKPTADEDNNAK